MAQPHYETQKRKTISVWVSNIIALLWHGELAMVRPNAHPLIAERIKRTPAFQPLTMPRHLQMYCN
jgi:hypothetical protein